MATLLQTGVVTVRIYKQKATNTALWWANTYELQVSEPLTLSGQWIQIAQNLAEAESEVHFGSTQYTRAVISTFVEDGEPYNPLSFITVPLTTVGQIDETGLQVEPLSMCLRVAFQADFGRQGFRLYRNALSEADVNSTSGVPVLEFGSVGTRVSAFEAALAPYLAPDGEPYLVLASEGNTRTVTGLTTAGVTEKSLRNRPIPPQSQTT